MWPALFALLASPHLLLNEADIARLRAHPEVMELVRTARSARDLGVAFQLTRDAAYANRARELLLSQSSPDGIAYDLVRGALTAADRARVETLLRESAPSLAVALVLEDREMIRAAVEAFRTELRECVAPDGTWCEGSWSDHFRALEELLLTKEMADRAGIAVPEASALKRMLDAGLLGLSGVDDLLLASHAGWYDVGYRVFGDTRYLAIAHKRPRTLEGWMWGAPTLPPAPRLELGSAWLPDAEIAVLRAKGSNRAIDVKGRLMEWVALPSVSMARLSDGRTVVHSTPRGTAHEESSTQPGGFYLVRTVQDRPVLVALGDAMSHRWVYNGTNAPVEVEWIAGAVEVHAKPGTVRVYAPEGAVIRVNGKLSEGSREGDFVKIRVQ